MATICISHKRPIMWLCKWTFSMDIAREICTDSFYTVNSGTPRIPVTAVDRFLPVLDWKLPRKWWKKRCYKNLKKYCFFLQNLNFYFYVFSKVFFYLFIGLHQYLRVKDKKQKRPSKYIRFWHFTPNSPESMFGTSKTPSSILIGLASMNSCTLDLRNVFLESSGCQ